MFDWLKSTFLGLLGPAVSFFAVVFNPLVAIVLGIWELAQFTYGLIGKSSEAFEDTKNGYDALLNMVGGSVFGELPAQIGSAVGLLNAFLPLTEALVLVGLGVVFYTACVVLRVIKSWIPTVN
jgi:hypothetical protein